MIERPTAIGKTIHGSVAGSVWPDGMQSFLGMPYAKPPVGDLRFEKPQPPRPWTGVYPAHAFGPVCPQIFEKTGISSQYPRDEDCLSVNVWTPGLDRAKRPVMVFIHGGAYIYRSSAEPLYDLGNLSRRGQIVGVSFNYRLGVLGYLDLSSVGGEGFLDSGNLAVFDQLAALTWVRDNIADFGGDPENVTVFGESAGGGSISTLLSVHQTRGLFRRAVPQSGAIKLTRSKGEALDCAGRFMEIAHVKDVKGLKSLSLADLLDAEEKLIRSSGLASDRLFGPVRDGRLIPVDPLGAIAEGSAKGIDLLTGTTKEEARYWITAYPELLEIPAPKLLSLMPETNAWTQEKKDEMIEHYAEKPIKYPGDAALAIATALFFRRPQVLLAEAQLGNGHVWMYLFTWPSPVKGGIYGAKHALELHFVLDTPDPEVGPNPPAELTEAMQGAWISFARTGNPGRDWPQYEKTCNRIRATMIFDVKSRVIDDPGGAEREFWEKWERIDP